MGIFSNIGFVSHDDDGFAGFIYFFKDLHYFHGGSTIQGPCGFICQDNLWIGNQGPGNGYSLFLPSL